jgi:hypothetical protein
MSLMIDRQELTIGASLLIGMLAGICLSQPFLRVQAAPQQRNQQGSTPEAAAVERWMRELSELAGAMRRAQLRGTEQAADSGNLVVFEIQQVDLPGPGLLGSGLFQASEVYGLSCVPASSGKTSCFVVTRSRGKK